MRSLLKTQVLVLLIIISLLSLPALASAQRAIQDNQYEYTVLQDQPAVGSSKMIPVSFLMLQSDELSPELPKEGKSDLKANCPNGFVPKRWSVFGMIGNTEWRDVGTWETMEVQKPLQAMGSVEFKIWFSYTGSSSPTGTFDFYWRREEENIAEAKNYNIRFENGMQPRQISVSAPLINQTPFKEGDIFSLYIRCRNNFDGAQILYGSREHASAVVMLCNALEIIKVDACKNHIKGIYDDIFQVKPNVMTYIAKIDNVVIPTLPEIDSAEVNGIHYRSVNWETKVAPGTHDVEVSIAYMGGENVSLMKQVKIKKPTEPTIFGIPLWIFYIIVGLIILAIIAGVSIKVYNHYQERKWYESRNYK